MNDFLKCPLCKKPCKPVGLTKTYKVQYENHICKPDYRFNEYSRSFYVVDNSYLII